jgi:hypothetical protein
VCRRRESVGITGRRSRAHPDGRARRPRNLNEQGYSREEDP